MLLVVKVAAMLFAGLWLRETMHKAEVTIPINQYATFNPYATALEQSDFVGGTDRLKMYKELLDSGVITKEELDAKKKEVLGL